MNIRSVIILSLACACAGSASALDLIRIKAAKKLDSRKNSGNQQAFGGRTSLTQKEYYYRFDVQALSPQVANPLKFEWVVMLEDWSGRVRPATHGTCETNVAMTGAVPIETETVHLNERNWQGPGGRAGKVEDKIAGYGLRVTDKNGNLIAEDYDPVSLKKEIDWKMVDGQPSEEAMRALRGLMEGGPRPGGPPPRPPRREP